MARVKFAGFSVKVTEDTLEPRALTVMLVDRVRAELPEDWSGWVADLGTGTGCVAIAIAKVFRRAHVVATDISGVALAVAEKNLREHALTKRVSLEVADWCDHRLGMFPLFDMIVSNPPYIPSRHVRSSGRDPAIALDGGKDGLDHIRRIIGGGKYALAPHGVLAVEHAGTQVTRVRRLFADFGYEDIVSVSDSSGMTRVTQGRYPV